MWKFEGLKRFSILRLGIGTTQYKQDGLLNPRFEIVGKKVVDDHNNTITIEILMYEGEGISSVHQFVELDVEGFEYNGNDPQKDLLQSNIVYGISRHEDLKDFKI